VLGCVGVGAIQFKPDGDVDDDWLCEVSDCPHCLQIRTGIVFAVPHLGHNKSIEGSIS
jgi:hypothetical protein